MPILVPLWVLHFPHVFDHAIYNLCGIYVHHVYMDYKYHKNEQMPLYISFQVQYIFINMSSHSRNWHIRIVDHDESYINRQS